MAPTGRTGHGGKLSSRFDVFRTAGTALVRNHLSKPIVSEAENTDVLILWRLDRVWERNTIELISHALEPGFLSNLLEATSPGDMRLRQDALECVAGNFHLLAVVSK